LTTRWDVARELWRSRIGGALRGLVALQFGATLGLFLLGLLHERGLLTPQLPPGEHWSMFDCFYFATITITTVGFGETVSPTGSIASYPDVRAYTAIVLMLSMVTTAYLLSSATAFFVEGDLKHVLERRRMERRIAALSGHFIVCGAGQIGRHIAEEVLLSGQELVIVEADRSHVALLPEAAQALTIVGDADKDENLLAAGIERAAGLAAALADDKDNVFLTLTARQMNPRLRIVAKAVDMLTRTKLVKAGADAVVSASYIGGLRMASELVRPTVVSFLDVMMRKKDAAVRFAEVTVGAKHGGVSLKDLDIRQRTGLLVVAVKPPGDEAFVYNPGPTLPIQPGAVLVVMGGPDQVVQLERLVGGAGPVTIVKDATRRHERVDIEERLARGRQLPPPAPPQT
jgi:voltage-gated potassium channel